MSSSPWPNGPGLITPLTHYVLDQALRQCRQWRNAGHELAESTIMVDPVHALEILSRLNTMGVQLSIDDFGTGYSSPAHHTTHKPTAPPAPQARRHGSRNSLVGSGRAGPDRAVPEPVG
jgi:EAL domain-containing protein (putative c-di-GMP-specific phosphodiesterase class I)